MGIGGDDQKILQKKNLTEVDCAIKYTKIALQENVKVNLFLTGVLAKKETTKVVELSKYENLFIGGHTFNSLQPHIKHLFFEKFFSSYYGTKKFQQKDIKKTLELLENVLGKK